LNQWAERAKFWRTIPLLSTAAFLAAVFCVFGAIGFLCLDVNPDLATPLQAALVVLISGVFAVGYALAGTRHRPRALFFLIPSHISAYSLLSMLGHRAAARFDISPALKHKILLDDIGAISLTAGLPFVFRWLATCPYSTSKAPPERWLSTPSSTFL